MGKLYTLQLTDSDGNNVFSRQVQEKHVKEVARFLEENMGLIVAAQGGFQVAKGIESIIAGLGAGKKRRGR